MDQIGTWVTHHIGWLWTASAGLTLILLGIVVAQASQAAKLRRQWSALMTGTSNANLEAVLNDHLRAQLVTDARIKAAESDIDTLQMKMESSKRYIGLIKFDAFDDVGGQQSFALALYDEQGNGVVVSSLVGRADARVYCKEIKSGKADRDLSSEERQAIELAAKNRSEAAVRS